MRKGTTLIGKVIVTYDVGEQIGTVADVLFDVGKNQLLGVRISENEKSAPSLGVRLEHVHALGADAVIIASRAHMQPLDTSEDTHRWLQRNLHRMPLSVYTTDGRNLGTLVDLYCDERTGEVRGYEVSGGAFAAESFGTSFVPSSQDVRVGISVVMVPAETVTLMTEVQEASSIHPATLEETQGRRARCAVQTDDGCIIAAQGQIVTDAVIDSARTHHREQALQDAVCLTTPPPHRVSEDALSLLHRTRDRVREGTSQLVTGSEKVWDQVKGTVTHLVQRDKHRNDQSESGGESTGATSAGDERTHAHHHDNRQP